MKCSETKLTNALNLASNYMEMGPFYDFFLFLDLLKQCDTKFTKITLYNARLGDKFYEMFRNTFVELVLCRKNDN